MSDTPDVQMNWQALFGAQGRTAVITGGSGELGRAMAAALARAGARVAILARHEDAASSVAEAIQKEGGAAIAVACDVLDRGSLDRSRERVLDAFGPADILINAAGGNSPSATTTPEQSFFDLDADAVNRVLALNFTGSFQACQVFGRDMVERKQGCIVNVTSMSALRPLTRIAAYSAAKAAVANFTQWLAVHMAQEYSPNVRVNALAPGFFLTGQNRYLLTNPDGTMTPRGQTIISHTPAGRLGAPDDLAGTLLWLVSPAAAFVTGVVVPIDGGFAAFSGV